MEARAYDDPVKFEESIGELYSADPVGHTLAITVLGRFVHDPAVEPVMLTVHRGGELYGATFRTPPWPLIASGLPVDAAPVAAELLAECDPELPGVNGPRALAEGLALAWSDLTGAGVEEAMAGRLYQLGDLWEPTVPGAARVGTEDDIELLASRRRAFQTEALGHDRDFDRAEEIIRLWMSRGDLYLLWENGGEPVSWAHASAPIDGMARVGPVYTPPEHRGRGYGSAVTAATSRMARDAGARHVLLFTDLANPTSNSIYQQIGYRPVHDTCELEFIPPPTLEP
jgi:GNAT superfamily N-acetyltransferase